MPQALAAFRQSGLVEFAEPDYLLRALVRPNDFHYVDQPNLHNTGIYGGVPGADIMAEAGWDLQREANDIVVAVLDTGVRYTHEDLAANMWVNPGESGVDGLGRDRRTNNFDDDGNGYIDDVHGINVLTGSGNPFDDWGHGTHVAGIVGAVGNNGVGVAGVAWRVKIMACKFIDAAGNSSVSDAIECLDYARAKGAKIITASWGGYGFDSPPLRDAIAALRDAGIIVTAAAGNDNNNNDTLPLYPASYDFDNIVAVAATDRTDARAAFSNYGVSTVDLGAPGAPVFSLWAGSDHDYRYNDGTSMAAPHLAGACALLWARYPGENYQQILQRILTTVDLLPSLAGRTKTGGRLNLAAALGSGSPPPPAPLAAPAGLSATASSATSVTLAWIDHASNETGFELQRSTDNITFVAAGTAGANATSATAAGLAVSTTYYFRVRAVRDGVGSAFSNTTVATTSPPAPGGSWLNSDIGAVAAAGSASESNGTVTIAGSGADIWDGADEFRYRYRSWTGDGEIVARVTSLGNTHGWAKTGVMFRETLAADSRHVFACVAVTNGTSLQYRPATGGASDWVPGGPGNGLPRWVRLVRSGSIFTGYESSDGASWHSVGSVTLALPATIYVGLAVTSHNDGVLCTATLDQVALGGGMPPAAPPAAPGGLTASAVSASQINLVWTDNSANETGFAIERSVDNVVFATAATTAANSTQYFDTGRSDATTYYYRIRAVGAGPPSAYSATVAATTAALPPGTASWIRTDIGAVGLAGSDEAGGNTITIRGSGADVWDSVDAFRFVGQVMSGDCSVEAEVASIGSTHAWAKAGVMIRESLAPNARNMFAFVTPSNGMVVQSRQASGGATSAQAGSWWVHAPYWVRLVRAGQQITAFESANGVTWTQIATYSVALTSSVYVGFAVTAHDSGQLNTAVFADPSIK